MASAFSIPSVEPFNTHKPSEISEADVKAMVLKEFLDHTQEYMPYSCFSAEDTLAQLEDWAEKGIYGSDTVDLILNILSASLNVKIVIVQESDGCVTTLELPAKHPHHQSGPVTLIKRNEHFTYAVNIVKKEYDAILQKLHCSEVIVISSSSDGKLTASLEQDSVAPIKKEILHL